MYSLVTIYAEYKKCSVYEWKWHFEIWLPLSILLSNNSCFPYYLMNSSVSGRLSFWLLKKKKSISQQLAVVFS